MSEGKLPVLATALDAWRTLFGNFGAFLRLALPLALGYVLFMALYVARQMVFESVTDGLRVAKSMKC